MTTIDVLDATGGKTGSVELPAEIFDVQVNVPLIHQVVVGQLAAARQGTHATKTRGQVAGGGAKPYRQKGTGRARQGSIRAPQFAGGGVVHGPAPRDYSQRTPKKMKAAALRGALSDRARHGRVHVVAGFLDGDSPSTKAGLAALRKVTERANALVVVARGDELTAKSLRNVPEVHLLHADQLNTYDVLCADDVIFTQAAFEEFLSGRGIEVEVTEAKPAKKATAKKATAEKTAAKKTATEKSATEKTAAEKTATEKTATKKTAAKKSSAEKAAAKKSTARKAAAKPADDASADEKTVTGDEEDK
ncbi:MAG TPA: 50S ribosomal protein L4 [Jiangellaceae bacterium]